MNSPLSGLYNRYANDNTRLQIHISILILVKTETSFSFLAYDWYVLVCTHSRASKIRQRDTYRKGTERGPCLYNKLSLLQGLYISTQKTLCQVINYYQINCYIKLQLVMMVSWIWSDLILSSALILTLINQANSELSGHL